MEFVKTLYSQIEIITLQSREIFILQSREIVTLQLDGNYYITVR